MGGGAKLTVALCDDDAAFRAVLRPAVEAVLAQNGLCAECFETASAGELSAALGHVDFDLILLDIDMPGMDGIRFGEELRARGCRSDIVYVSNMDDKVFEIFRVHPWSFIRKSRFAEELPAVLEEYARTRRDSAERLLLAGADGQTLSVNPKELLYVEAVGKTQRLFYPDGTEDIRDTMRDLEEKLLPFGFIRTHKGFLVNYRFIRKITSRSVLLDTGRTLPIGRDRLGPARESYLTLMKWKGLPRRVP